MALSNKKGAEEFYSLTSSAGIESKSGLGSFIENTNEIREALPVIFERYRITSVVDCPCGDWNWMRLVPLSGIDYFGLDIIPSIISSNIQLYQRPGVRFAVHDMISDPLPKADLIICRDFLFHISLDQIEACIKHVRDSGSRYILTTTFPWIDSNQELSPDEIEKQWGWRMINVEKPPLNLSLPLESIRENKTCKFREVRLYEIKN